QVAGRPAVTLELVRHLLVDGSHERALALWRPLAAGTSVLVSGCMVEVRLDDGDAFHDASLELTRAARNFLLEVSPGRPPLYEVARLAREAPLDIAQQEQRDSLVELVAEYRATVASLDGVFGAAGNAIYLHGAEGHGVRELADAVASAKGDHAVVMDGRILQTQSTRLGELLREAFDVAAVHQIPLILDGFGELTSSQGAALMALVGPKTPLVLICGETDLSDLLKRCVLMSMRVTPPRDEVTQVQLWAARLPREVDTAAVDVDYLAQVYPYDRRTISAVTRLATVRAVGAGKSGIDHDLAVRAAATFAPTSMSTLARETPARGTLADIILPADELDVLRRIIEAGRTFERALAEWGLGRLFSYGKSLTALFVGEPGTGKTHAAKILASEIGRKLFVINVDRIMSKWAGETEKNLHEVFTAVGGQGGVLLFDEADSLFSKRVEVSSSNDKYSNMLTNTLLTEIEEYKGIVLLTTNKPKSIDSAFERRIMYMLTFTRPDADHRRRLWEYMASAGAPIERDVDFARLGAQFDLSGGEIKNAFLRAAFEAYSRARPITMAHLTEACREEYQKKGKVS
ncbi:MAG: ATP-binding protein, partial [Kofleriaceae bacterium]|nr:ATP-binding protein [Kofleriaceae bacterium]